MNNYKIHFERELEILRQNVDKDDNLIIEDFIPIIYDILDVFATQGHSGGSAPYYSSALSNTIKKVLSFEPLSPITGKDSEWNDVSGMGGDEREIYQNNRLSSVFKEGKDGKPYYIDAVIFRGQNDTCFTGNSTKLKNGDSIASRQYIKLPFKPKKFYIDVIETEWTDQEETVKKEGGGWWTSVVKDESQLDEVWEYYEKIENKKDE